MAQVNPSKLDSISPRDYRERVAGRLEHVLDGSHLTSDVISGKVRDCYDLGDSILLVTSDRVSAFDRRLACIPYKGQVLNQVSLWWFERTKHILPNHVLSCPDPNAVLCKKCTVFPIEFVVRGYITGSTGTSMWTHYNRGVRDYCGHSIPEGLVKNQRLSRAIVTPTTKSDEHDELISAEEIVSRGIMGERDWQFCQEKALQLFEHGQKLALEHGMLLVDTKYEFGKDKEGNILIIDEMHTPDSSRYWLADTYEERFASGQPPDSIDKDILRQWFAARCDPYKDEVLPEAPTDLVVLVACKYLELYERITGAAFPFPPVSEEQRESMHERLQRNTKHLFLAR